jgi:hypothetical protein
VYGRGSRSAPAAVALALCLIALAAMAGVSAAAQSRKPMRDALAAARHPARAFDSAVRPRPAALRAMVRRSAQGDTAGEDEFQISSDSYGAAEVASVAATLRSLDHGPEMAELSVFVATPAEIRDACGATVVACYFPSTDEMVVSGVDRPVAGVPRDFAIAHEYGHHIANTREGGALPAIEAGPVRWATYERVCQLTRRGRLFPGDQGAHYWEDPEEAFAQSYAHLNRPGAGVSWQYTPLLRPTTTSLAKIHADVTRPLGGPLETDWAGTLSAPPAKPSGRAATTSARTPHGAAPAIGPARAVGDVPWVDSDLVRTPLDGPVSVSLRAPAGADLSLVLRDPRDGRPLARTATDPDGDARLTYSNCGHATLELEVGNRSGAASFEAAIARP